MDNPPILHYLSTHHFAVMAVAFFAFFVAYFIFKKLVKLALLFLLLLLAAGGYFYFKDPHKKATENILQTVQKAGSVTGKVVEKSKQAYRKSKDIYEKGKKLGKDLHLLPEKEKESSSQDQHSSLK
jgi:apolipoprotein N-acyltransferase